MVRVGDIFIGEGQPKICASITETDRKAVIAAADLLLQKRIDIVEWRIDFYSEVTEWEMVLGTLQRLKMSLSGKPLLVTFRTSAEGGNREISGENYRILLERLADSGFVDMVDVEIFKAISYEDITADDSSDSTWQQFTQLQHWIEKLSQKVVVIGSYHNFDATPSDAELEKRLEIIAASGVDIPKMAVMPQDKMDVLRLMTFTLREQQKLGKPLITMSMGKLGSISRVSGEAFGSSVTFGSIGQESAPGQIPVNKLEEMLEMVHQNYQ
jgi:3-dehydroquinate dehydratase-1